MDINNACVVVDVAPSLIYCDLSTLCPRQNAYRRQGEHYPQRPPKERVSPPAFKMKSAICASLQQRQGKSSKQSKTSPRSIHEQGARNRGTRGTSEDTRRSSNGETATV
jgi:hypothetical protein